MKLNDPYRCCVLCPRQCRVNRTAQGPGPDKGVCGETDQLRVAYVGPHFGEEPPITGTNGSGTVFFTGCSLRCIYCQNHQISRGGIGVRMSPGELAAGMVEMVERHHVHNINWVTPDHFLPHVFDLVTLLRGRGIHLPFVYNLSGYQSTEALTSAENFADIYLPDFKYSDPVLAAALSKCKDYPVVALEAIAAMVRQKGFLNTVSRPEIFPATKGVLVRHLILPGKIANSINALTSLFVEFGPGLPLSLMSQYHPVFGQRDPDLNRQVLKNEFDTVLSHAQALGFEHLFVQFPDTPAEPHRKRPLFLPDFERSEPFLCSG